LDKEMAKIALLLPRKTGDVGPYSKYIDEDLRSILDFTINCDRMTQEMTSQIEAEAACDITTQLPEAKSHL
jgi:hypothetical protein